MGRADADYETPRREPRLGFAEVVCRDPFSIVGRYPNPGFRLADLAQMRIATVSEVPTPWSCLQEQVGIDPARLDRITDRSMAENFNALTEGRIEWARFFEPVVEQALASGKGHLWHAASARGRTSYIAFVTTRERLVRDAEPLLCMVRAIQRTQQWLYARSAQEMPRPFPRSSQRSTSACWPPLSPTTNRSR